MNHWAQKSVVVAASWLAMSLSSTREAKAQTEPAKPTEEQTTEEKANADAPTEAASEPAAAAPVESTAEAPSSGLSANAAPENVSATATNVTEATPEETAPEKTAAADNAELRPVTNRWDLTIYGFLKADMFRDSTQSFIESTQPGLIARPGTYAGQHPRTVFTARDTRLGLKIVAPEYQHIKSSGVLELDFFAIPPTDSTQNDFYVFGPVRMRHAYFKLETPVVDVLAGQYHELFGWNGSGFFPGTLAFLGVLGEIYHRNPQVRLSKTIGNDTFGAELAVAAVRPAQRDSSIPDLEGGLKLSLNSWQSASVQGAGQPGLQPLAVGVSGIWRHYKVPEFRQNPQMWQDLTASGIAVNASIPIIPVKTAEDRSNGLTATGEFSTGTGIADLYTGMTGGSKFPILPNPEPQNVWPLYPQNIDSGLVTFDSAFNAQTVDWQAFVFGLQYFLPIDSGRVWIEGVYSQVKSGNIKELTPSPNYGSIFTKAEYIDASVVFAITPAAQIGFSFQTMKQTFGDTTQPEPMFGQSATQNDPNGGGTPVVAGTGGDPISARNNRGQLSMVFFF